MQAGGHSEEAAALAGQAEELSEVEQAVRLAEEWDDSWRGLGMDEAEERLPGAPVQAGGHSEEATALAGQAEGLSEVEQAARLAEEWDVMQRE